jgi:hypothetical protein
MSYRKKFIITQILPIQTGKYNTSEDPSFGICYATLPGKWLPVFQSRILLPSSQSVTVYQNTWIFNNITGNP